jgi:hypothetical protein
LLVLGCAAQAQGQLEIANPGARVGPRSGNPPEQAELVGPSAGLFRNAPAGLGLSRRTLTQQDGSPASRNGVVGSWSLSPGMQAGVGLFSVTADSRKQADTRRMPSTDSVAPKRQRIAAVGLSLSF